MLSQLMEMTMLTKRGCLSASLVTLIALIGATEAIADTLCRPAFALDDVEFSAMIPPTSERVWSAVVAIDASACTENSKGKFEIVFTRLSENAPDLELRKQYMWSAPSSVWSVPLLGVGLALAADEAVGHYRIDNVTPCTCRNYPSDVNAMRASAAELISRQSFGPYLGGWNYLRGQHC